MECLGEAADNPYTSGKLIAFGIEVLKNTREFEDGFSACNKTVITNKTCIKFNNQFQNEKSELKSVQGKAMQSTSFHKYNYMTSQVLQEVQNVQQLIS